MYRTTDLATRFDRAVERMNEKFTEAGLCNYCFEEVGSLRKVRLRIHFRAPWQKSTMQIGENCRKYLRGLFKYV